MAEEEKKYTSDYSGETTDAILEFADKIRQQAEAGDGETVQVYDTDGNPHKVSKTELMKKSALALPSLSDISAFVAINQAGDAVGIMSKEFWGDCNQERSKQTATATHLKGAYIRTLHRLANSLPATALPGCCLC